MDDEDSGASLCVSIICMYGVIAVGKSMCFNFELVW